MNIYICINPCKKSFSSIAEKVELTLHTDNKQCSENDIGVYWKHFLATTTFSPAHQEMIMQQTPKITDNKIMLTSRNETESNILKKKTGAGFQSILLSHWLQALCY